VIFNALYQLLFNIQVWYVAKSSMASVCFYRGSVLLEQKSNHNLNNGCEKSVIENDALWYESNHNLNNGCEKSVIENDALWYEIMLIRIMLISKHFAWRE